MSKKSLQLSETQVKILLRNPDLYSLYQETQKSLIRLIEELKSQEWDTEILSTLFPHKEGYQIQVHENGTLSFSPLSISELRQKIKSQGLDSGNSNLTKRELIALLKNSQSHVDGKTSHEIIIPKIGK